MWWQNLKIWIWLTGAETYRATLRQYAPLKRRYTSTRPQSVVSRKGVILNVAYRYRPKFPRNILSSSLALKIETVCLSKHYCNYLKHSLCKYVANIQVIKQHAGKFYVYRNSLANVNALTRLMCSQLPRCWARWIFRERTLPATDQYRNSTTSLTSRIEINVLYMAALYKCLSEIIPFTYLIAIM
jgi:hypothetical protein